MQSTPYELHDHVFVVIKGLEVEARIVGFEDNLDKTAPIWVVPIGKRKPIRIEISQIRGDTAAE